MQSLDWWDELLNNVGHDHSKDKFSIPWLIVVIPTWSHGLNHEDAKPLVAAVDEISNDWRVDPNHLNRKLKYAVFGVGSSAYDESTFCKVSESGARNERERASEAS